MTHAFLKLLYSKRPVCIFIKHPILYRRRKDVYIKSQSAADITKPKWKDVWKGKLLIVHFSYKHLPLCRSSKNKAAVEINHRKPNENGRLNMW